MRRCPSASPGKIAFAGALLAASLLVADLGVGVTPAAAQDIVVTEGHIARLHSVLRCHLLDDGRDRDLGKGHLVSAGA